MTTTNERRASGAARRGLFIDGEFTSSRSGRTFPTVNPATGAILAEVDEAGADDVDAAVESGRAALGGEWGRASGARRAQLLWSLADLVEARLEDLARIDALDAGKPIRDGRSIDGPGAVGLLRYFAGVAQTLRGSEIPVPGFLNYTAIEPFGVVGAIIPWNYPLYNAVLKVAPALACGNVVVLKPAEQTPLSALELGVLAIESGFPPGVLNVVPGFGPGAGARLVAHPDVPKIAFTGSTDVGRAIMRSAADSVKSLTLELGGKGPNIVFADADLDDAVAASLYSVFRNQGQTCSAGTRVIIDRAIEQQFVERVVAAGRALVIGDPIDPRTRLGPLVSADQLARVHGYIASGLEEGAELATGGVAPDLPGLREGYFLQPTVFRQVEQTMRIAREEIFGPVLTISTFDDEDEAVAMANDVDYGLSAALWTRDIKRAHRTASRLEAGMIWINTIHAGAPGSPAGGFKQSGIGVEKGLEAVREYTRIKSVWVELDDNQISWARDEGP
jgi:acyl-CoA reductase-like NAD-dependent aldehyde dehydrogenase